MTNRTIMVALLALGAVTPAWAQSQQATPGLFELRIAHIDRHPATPAAARRTLARIDRAVSEACGASGFSLREVKQAVHASSCWHETMADAVRQIDDPRLRAAYLDRSREEPDHVL